MRACLLLLAARTNATPDPPPGPERLPNALDPTGTGLVPHNYSCFAPNPKGEPFSATFAPRYPDVAPRYHICNSCHSENDPCAAFYYKGVYHYMYQEHDNGGITGGHVVSRDLVTWQELSPSLWPDKWYISAAVWDFSATIVDGVPTIIAAGVVAPGAKKNESDPNSPWCHALAQPTNLSDPKLVDWHYPPDRNPTMCGTKENGLTPGDSPSNTWSTVGGEYRYVDAYGLVYTSRDFRHWTQAANASALPVGSSFPIGCCQDLYPLPPPCDGCAGEYLGEGSPKTPTHIWSGWPPGTPGVYELIRYHEGPVNSSGVREVLPLGLPALGLNFTWHDWGHFAATKSFHDPVHDRRIVAGWLAPDVATPGTPLQFKYNTQSLLREVRYDPRLRVLTTFPVAETEQLRGAAPLATVPAGMKLSSARNHTLVASGANQTEVRLKLKLEPWPTAPISVGLRVMTANASSTDGVELYVTLYPPPSADAKVWQARAVSNRTSMHGPTMAGLFPVIAGEDIEVAVYIDNTWIEWFVNGGRFAQTVAVPGQALVGGAEQGVVLWTNATGGVQVEGAAWAMRSIWHNSTTHDRPPPA